MTEPDEPREMAYVMLIRMLAERYPDQVAEQLRELGYEVGEPADVPEVDETLRWPEDSASVLDFALDLLQQSEAASVDIDVAIEPGEYWMGEATDEVIGMHIGQQLLVNVHSPEACAGHSCVLHAPSDHHMRTWPLLWRGDRRIMERICPHRVGHPDPDDLAYQMRMGYDSGVHGCDGCCRA